VGDGSLLIVVLSTLVVSVATLVGLGVAARRLRPNRPARDGPAPDANAPSNRPSPAGPLIRGYGYVGASLTRLRRREGVSNRLARAFERIDQVDPYAAARRVGMAMLHAGLVSPPTWPPRDGPAEQPPTDPFGRGQSAGPA